jgi:hypothetical protein
MEVVVKGVRIELTKEQASKIEKELRDRKKEMGTFEKVLLHFGFKKMNMKDWPHKQITPYEHKENGWYAEIQNNGRWSDVWMVGKGLKCAGFPGGWQYFTPQEIENEIIKAIDTK